MKLGGAGKGKANFVVARGVWKKIQLHKGNGRSIWAWSWLVGNGSNGSSFVIVVTFFSLSHLPVVRAIVHILGWA